MKTKITTGLVYQTTTLILSAQEIAALKAAQAIVEKIREHCPDEFDYRHPVNELAAPIEGNIAELLENDLVLSSKAIHPFYK